MPDIDWIDDLYEADTHTGLKLLARKMYAFLAESEFESIDAVLAAVDWTRLDDTVICGMVRYPSVAKNFLANWQVAVQKVYDEYVRRDLPAEKIMTGLMGWVKT